jgi:riboflavin synthase
MFTGIIEEIGKVKSMTRGAQSAKLTIQASKVLEDTKIGDSIATNGVCLTVVRMDDHTFTVDVMPETVRKSSFRRLNSGDLVNLERALPAQGRFDGHIVAGHVDSVGTIKNITTNENAIVIRISTDPNVLKYIINEGSIAVDGISLTVARVYDDGFEVSIIPHTKGETNLHNKKIGDLVNLECDVIGKYVERLLNFKEQSIDMDFLGKNGFL